MLHHRVRGQGLRAGPYNKGLTENSCRMGELIVKQIPGLVLVNGGFKFKQTDGQFGSVNIHSAAD